MPELPEVETFTRKLRPHLLGRIITDADLRWQRTLAVPSARKFRAWVRGQQIEEVTRRAKYFILRLSDYNLLIHLRMSGDLLLKEGRVRAEKHDRLILTLASPVSGELSSLVFNDTRKFGRVWLTAHPEEVLGKLGPEPLSRTFTPQWLHSALQAKHRQLKPLLLDQSFLSGLGNIYTDESLHLAKLHPLTPSNVVTPQEAALLHEAIRQVLKEGIRRQGASIDWVYRGGEFQNFFRVYDRAGKPCPTCGAEIQRLIVGQRSTHFCPGCQVVR